MGTSGAERPAKVHRATPGSRRGLERQAQEQGQPDHGELAGLCLLGNPSTGGAKLGNAYTGQPPPTKSGHLCCARPTDRQSRARLAATPGRRAITASAPDVIGTIGMRRRNLCRQRRGAENRTMRMRALSSAPAAVRMRLHRKRRREGREVRQGLNYRDRPFPDQARQPLQFQKARQCGARTRSGKPCRSPATKKGALPVARRRKRRHPPGERNGQYRHGERTKAAIAERQKFNALLKILRAGLM